MSSDRTFVGLDVHARSVIGHGLDGLTGEVWQRKLTPDPADILGWVSGLPGPVAVVYEAGPTGFGLARHLRGHGLRCLVAAPSKLQRPAGDRVKTDARDAAHLARLSKLDEIVEVAVPTLVQEAARDLVRAREDVREDLMRARHRLRKLLLRQGIGWTGGQLWTGRHDVWLRSQRFDLPGRQLAFDAAYETMLLTLDRRNRLDAAITEMAANSDYTDLVHRLGCLRGVSTLTGFGLAVEVRTGPASPARPSAPSWGWSRPSAPRAAQGRRVRSPRPVTATPAGCWSRRVPGWLPPSSSPKTLSSARLRVPADRTGR